MVYAANRIARYSAAELQAVRGGVAVHPGHAQAKAVVTEPEFVPAIDRISGGLTDLEHRIQIGGDDAGDLWTGYEELLARHKGGAGAACGRRAGRPCNG